MRFVTDPRSFRLFVSLIATLFSPVGLLLATDLVKNSPATREESRRIDPKIDRSPVDLAFDESGKWLVTANQTSGTVTLVDVESRQVVDEVTCGGEPADVVFVAQKNVFLVTCARSGDLVVYSVKSPAAGPKIHDSSNAARLLETGRCRIGFEPNGIAVDPSNAIAYVGTVQAGEVAVVDLDSLSVTHRIEVGNWPKHLTLSPNGTRLAIGCTGDSKIVVVDTKTREVLYDEPLAGGINLGHMTSSKDGVYAYFPWMVYRNNPITVGNIKRGWVLASRIGRVRLDGESYREAISLDVPERAIGDPTGIAISDDERTIVVTAGGTHELLVYRLTDLPFVGTGGPGDLIERELERDRNRFDRIELGGRPMGVYIAEDNRTAYVANFFRNSIQVVDLADRKLVDEIPLGGPDASSLARRGMELFYDAERSLDQWYSCHSCHQDGGTNSLAMDTMNDGTELTVKTVLPLYDVHKTAPYTWHGWQSGLDDAIVKSFTSTMIGKPTTPEETKAVIAYFESLELPPSSHPADTDNVRRGRKIFFSKKAACADCHNGPEWTDNEIHDVGLGSPSDAYDGFNTPSLRGVTRKVKWLHNGRAKTLERLLTDLHSPEKVQGEGELSDEKIADLIAFLKTL